MQQIKLFIGREDHTKDLEHEVNQWIASSGVEVLSISGNLSPQTVLPDKVGKSMGDAGSAAGRRFGASDIMVLVTYKKA